MPVHTCCMLGKVSYWTGLLREAHDNFNRNDGWAMASHMALSAILALFPFLIFATSIAAFFELGGFADEAVHLIFDYWPPAASEAIAGEVRTILTEPRRDVLTFGGLLTLYFASNGVEALRTALNRSYGGQDHRPYWLLRIQGLVFVVIAAIAMMAITLLYVLLPLGWELLSRSIPDIVPWTEAVWFWRMVVAIAVLTLALGSAHLFLPAGHRSPAGVLPGIVFTLVFWTAGSLAFGTYLEQFADYVSTYAGLAGAMIGLVFLYLLALILIFGAEINAAIAKHRI